MFNLFSSKKKIDPNKPPPGKTAAAIKSSRARIDSTVFHLFQWDGFGFILKPYSGDLVASQIFYPKITIELETDSITIAATAEVLTVGDQLAAKWVTMSGAEARWLKHYMLRHGPGYNPNIAAPAPVETDDGEDAKGKPGEARTAEKLKR
ncbi:MAG: hypothetical protein EXQ95_03075 [Alphaproteobacteria bacterium]|nr:hypothetical protein [Alphaproteobacteria bacterium]